MLGDNLAVIGRDRELISMGVARSESPHTRRNYERQAAPFLAFVAKPLEAVGLSDMQADLASLEGSPATRANATAASALPRAPDW
jgi:hypothetical protein